MADAPLIWRVRPAAAHPRKLLTLAGFAALAGLMGVILTRKPLFFLIGVLLILASTADFWLGVTYRVDAKGVSRRVGFSETAIGWDAIKRAEVQGDTLYLSPLEAPGRRDAFRGVRLHLPADRRAEIIARVRSLMPAEVGVPAT